MKSHLHIVVKREFLWPMFNVFSLNNAFSDFFRFLEEHTMSSKLKKTLKWINVISLWIVIESLHDVSTSHLEALVTCCFGLRELLRKQELVVDQLVSSSREGKHHMTTASRREAETSWSLSITIQSEFKCIHFNMNIGSNNTFSEEILVQPSRTTLV